MRHVIHETNPNNKYRVALLIKDSALNKSDLESYYINDLNKGGISSTDIITFSLDYNDNGKAPAKFQKDYISQLFKALDSLGVTTLLIADGAYFKTITGSRKSDPFYGYVLPCKIKGYEHLDCMLTANYKGIFYNPAIKTKLDLSLSTLINFENGTYTEIGKGIINSVIYPTSLKEIKDQLNLLHQYDKLTCDIETFGLRIDEAGLGTIAFAWADIVEYNIVQDGETIMIPKGTVIESPNGTHKKIEEYYATEYTKIP